MKDEILILGGSSSRKLTGQIAELLGVAPAKSEVLRFPEGNLFVRVLENVRGRQLYVVQSIALPANDAMMELLFWIDALKRASAASITAIMPYFSYAKGDKKDEPRVSIRARVCADAMQAAGVSRIISMDLHAPQVQGFFTVPVDDLYALPVLSNAIRQLPIVNPVIVSPDIGFAKKARGYANRLGASLAIADKQRLDHSGNLLVNQIIGDVAGRSAVIVDDFTITGGTLVEVARKLMELGARDVYAVVTHGLFAGNCMQRLDDSPIQRLLTTDTIETQPVAFSPKVQVVSVAPLFAEAIRRIHTRQSISVLFEE